MSVSLQKGQKIRLTKGNEGLSKVIIGLGWDEAAKSKGGLLGGLIGGPFLSGMIDTTLRALRDEPGYWWHTYKRAWKQNWKQSLLRGALLGYTRKFMDEKYDEIIAFAELEGFQDRPFKHLSSGMKSRLAFSIASLVLLVLLVLLLPFKGTIGPSSETNEKKLDRRRLILTTLQFLLCLATVVRIVDWRLTFFLLTASMVLFSRHLFRKVDYALLLTFIAFFVFSGNMARIPQLDSYIQGHIEGHAFGFALIASQIISNVPAAILLSRFTDAGMGLVYGTNIGGLGTLVALQA